MIQIDPNKVYNSVEILEITKQKDWIKSRRTLNSWIDKYSDLLKPTIQGEGNGKRYFILGSNLIDFIAQFEDGTLHAGARREIPVKYTPTYHKVNINKHNNARHQPTIANNGK